MLKATWSFTLYGILIIRAGNPNLKNSRILYFSFHHASGRYLVFIEPSIFIPFLNLRILNFLHFGHNVRIAGYVSGIDPFLGLSRHFAWIGEYSDMQRSRYSLVRDQ